MLLADSDEFTQAVKTKPVLFQCIVEPGGQPQPLVSVAGPDAWGKPRQSHTVCCVCTCEQTNFKDAVLNESVQLRDVFTMDRLRDAWERATNSTDMTYNFDALNLTAFRKLYVLWACCGVAVSWERSWGDTAIVVCSRCSMVDEFQCPQRMCAVARGGDGVHGGLTWCVVHRPASVLQPYV